MLCERAFRLSPHDPLEFMFFANLGSSLFFADRYAEAVDAFEKAMQLNRDLLADIHKAAALVRLGRLSPARDAIRRVVERVGEGPIEKMFWPDTEGTEWTKLTDALREIYEPSGKAAKGKGGEATGAR